MSPEDLAEQLRDPRFREAAELLDKAARYDAVLARAQEAEAELEEFADLFERWEAANEKFKARQRERLGKLRGILDLIEGQTGMVQADRDDLARRISRAARVATDHAQAHPDPLAGTCPACDLIVALGLTKDSGD